MKERSWHDVDKTEWPNGPWMHEPDKMQWIDDATELDCLIVRNPHFGFLCGYVGVPKSHSLHGRHYEDVDADVHGALTFASPCETDDHARICHIPEPGRPDDVWWLGFDCGHCDDMSPTLEKWYFLVPQIYKDLDYVMNEVTRLAQQLAE